MPLRRREEERKLRVVRNDQGETERLDEGVYIMPTWLLIGF